MMFQRFNIILGFVLCVVVFVLVSTVIIKINHKATTIQVEKNQYVLIKSIISYQYYTNNRQYIVTISTNNDRFYKIFDCLYNTSCKTDSKEYFDNLKDKVGE